ncbi:acetate--CoA ligase family protein [Sporosarcina ureilytica]|uniref:Acetyl-CoA synthetase n=1 Tax=Sporosarcina ureilytica TaxID=298596 RepID=A0A1D8JFE7_9BACL|nr:acetate--CoA ligase family protein [Sporosarcina ureilytica]AOV07432.1 acetyl-CoA synthetase [Sporosarcina ureilytica]
MKTLNEIHLSNLELDSLFHPRTIAVYGASENTKKIGYLQLQALLNGRFEGEIYPIHPSSKEIAGLPCYQSVKEVPNKVDLAILCVNINHVENCLIECGKSGVKAAIIFASGYSEIGEAGIKAQNRLKEIADRYNIRVIGPNCVGLLNTTNGLMGTFSPGLTNIPLGKRREVGFVTQSGAFGVLTYIAAAQHGLTFNYFVSVGNEVDVGFSDVIEYMLNDPNTTIASGYLEGEKNPGKLRELAKHALEINKPIVIMKSGRSSAGSRAAESHTGSLAGADKIYDGFFKQTGIVRADDYDDIISFSKLFLSNKLPAGRNTVIVTSSGGRGINEADRCESYGLNIHPLSDKVKSEIEKNIPSYASALNPIDLTAAASITHPELYIEPLKVLINDPETDIIIFSEFPMDWDENTPLLQEFVELCKSSDKLIFVTTFPLEGMSIPKGVQYLEDNGIPVITGNLNPIRSLAKLVEYSETYEKAKTQEQAHEREVNKQNIQPLLTRNQTLSESQSSEILSQYGIQTTIQAVADTETNAVKIANEIGYPVVLKIDSPDIPHKTEVDGIRLNITSDQELKEAFQEIYENAKEHCPSANIHGISVQQMLPEGVEVIVGVTNDPTFGPVIMFGLGGVFVEVFKDVSFRVAPITRQDAISMMEELRGHELLKGVRNKKAADKEAIIDVLLKVSALIQEYQDDIQEIDINPLIVYEKGITAADALIVTK